MSYFLISELEKHINSLKDSNSKSSSIEEIRKILRDISVGIGTDERQRKILQPILNDLSLITKGQLHSDIRRVVNRIKGDRRQIAEHFYVAHNESSSGVEGINFNYEVEVRRLHIGVILYQWCAPLFDRYSPSLFNQKNEQPLKAFQDKKGYSIHVGNYYSPSIVSTNKLGVSELVDIMIGDMYLGTGTRNLYRFKLPFDADCLISTAGRAVDAWISRHNRDGSKISGQGFSCSGGAVQYYIPLSDEKKKLLAQTGEYIR